MVFVTVMQFVVTCVVAYQLTALNRHGHDIDLVSDELRLLLERVDFIEEQS